MFKKNYVCTDPHETDSVEYPSIDGVAPETLENFRGNKGEEGT